MPANVSQQLDDMASHATLKLAANKVKQQYAQLCSWRARLLKQSAEDLAEAVAHEDLAVEIENILTRYNYATPAATARHCSCYIWQQLSYV